MGVPFSTSGTTRFSSPSLPADLDARGSRHALPDWLALHGISPEQCLDVLDRAERYQILTEPPTQRGPPATEAWGYAASALEAFVPGIAGAISRTREMTTLRCDAQGSRPLTAPFRGAAVVLMDYRGRVGDMLALAHEFGHALQGTLTRGGFVTPIVREICGFAAELSVLAMLRNDRTDLHQAALLAWRADNAVYIGRHGAALRKALSEPDSPYVYGWNYPIARVLASECSERLPDEALRSVFENRVSISGLATFLGCPRHGSPACNMACLEISGDLFTSKSAR